MITIFKNKINIILNFQKLNQNNLKVSKPMPNNLKVLKTKTKQS